jgi:hypothetical protein
MKRVFLFCLLLISAAAPFALADSESVPGTDISFMPPDGFTPLTQEELDLKFPTKNGPKFAYGNERRSTTVAYDVRAVAVTADALRDGLESIGESMARVIPGAVWVDKKMMKLAGLDWAYYELTSNALDTDIHNIILMGPWGGKLVVFNFNATKADFEKLEPTLRASMNSITLKKP